MPVARGERHVAHSREAVDELSVEELRKRLNSQDRSIEQIRGDVSLQTGAIQRIETAFAELRKQIGTEEEDGKGGYTGTGIIGRTRRTEREMLTLKKSYARLIWFGSGFTANIVIVSGVIWYLIGDKVGLVLK